MGKGLELEIGLGLWAGLVFLPTAECTHRGVSVAGDRFLNGLFMGMASFMVWLWATLGFLFDYVGYI